MNRTPGAHPRQTSLSRMMEAGTTRTLVEIRRLLGLSLLKRSLEVFFQFSQSIGQINRLLHRESFAFVPRCLVGLFVYSRANLLTYHLSEWIGPCPGIQTN